MKRTDTQQLTLIIGALLAHRAPVGHAMAIGRFQVMATLQAARALQLGLPEQSAKAWGLNRAIFYAAAKRGFRGGSRMSRERREGGVRPRQPPVGTFRLGDDLAFHQQAGTLYFTIGGQVQTEKDFARQVERRFEGRFDQVWKEALALVRQHDRSVLLSQQAFYDQVYKPRRDELALKWSELVAKQPLLGAPRKVAKTSELYRTTGKLRTPAPARSPRSSAP